MELTINIKAWLVWGAVGVMLLALVVAATAHTAAREWRDASPLARGAFLAALLVAMLYGCAAARKQEPVRIVSETVEANRR